MQRLTRFTKIIFFFLLGASLMSLILVSCAYIIFSLYYQHRIYPGVKIGGIDVSEKTPEQIATLFDSQRYYNVSSSTINIASPEASVSATVFELGLKVDSDLMSRRAFSIGRQTSNPYYNLLQIHSAWQGKIDLPFELALDKAPLKSKLAPLALEIEKPAVDAIFEFQEDAGPDQKGRVKAFSPSINGIAVDYDKIAAEIISQAKTNLLLPDLPAILAVPLYTKVVTPEIQTSTAEKYGLHDLLGSGESYFYDSIPGRVYNIGLGTEKISGSLIAPDEIFSFNDSIGTISAIFGFQKAYAIIKGKTVLDDGGGVCQVSTTVYRTALNAGLPIVQRAAHAYRVGFYEQGGFKPGLDATVYPPDPDFKFKNDTGNWLLLQANFDQTAQKLTFELFGTADGRETQIEGPFILSQTPPPEPIYEDDPNKPAGQIVQVDTAHPGAKTSFTRTVTRNDEVIIKETVVSDYIPWPARFLRGTKI